MGIRIFSNSSFDNKRDRLYLLSGEKLNEINSLKERLDKLEKANSKQPRADKFKIKQEYQFGKILILVVVYLNCTNYEGEKILVFKNTTVKELLKKNKGMIDPHFSENSEFISPIARFVPNEEGFKLAVELAKIMDKE